MTGLFYTKPWEIFVALPADRVHFHSCHNPGSIQATKTNTRAWTCCCWCWR